MKKTGKNDTLLILVLLIAALVSGAGIWIAQEINTKEGMAVVTIDGELYKKYSLKRDLQEKILLPNGSYNDLVIKEGKADITDASCADKICVDHRPVNKVNQSIVCLPNRVMVTIENGEESDIDSQTY